MASLNGEIKISVEALLHKALFDFAEQVDEKHNVKLDSVRFSWASYQTLGGVKLSKLVEISIDSSARL